jgi:protein arginine kinase
MNNWISGTGPQNDIILSSRIRLARNISNIPFPALMDESRAREVIDLVNARVEAIEKQQQKYLICDLTEADPTEKQILVERHLISPNMAKAGCGGAAVISEDEVISILVNEEDHIRIQSILPGLQIKKAWEIASEVDDILESGLDYAFDENWGYLTSCPTNVGTGLRASVMIHLPALNMTGNINKILQAVTQIGLTIRGLYGEGTDIVGSIFQISNQITLGRSEEELVENLAAVTMQIIEKEKNARNMLLENNRAQLEDKVWRSFGLMTNARLMQSQECMKLLSDIRLGVDLKILQHIPIVTLNEIMVESQPASLQKQFDCELSTEERDKIRAEMIRKKLMSDTI